MAVMHPNAMWRIRDKLIEVAKGEQVLLRRTETGLELVVGKGPDNELLCFDLLKEMFVGQTIDLPDCDSQLLVRENIKLVS